MTPPPLPDDVRRWPRDPYELLGVQPGVSARELRKAYIARIRLYKPEQSPEEFRRIREAYESVQQQLEFMGSFAVPAPEEAPQPDPPPGPDAEPEVLPAPRSERVPEAESTADHRSEPDRAWDLVCQGDPATAYRQMRQFHEFNPGALDAILRLYWIRELFPEVDPDRMPADWLKCGLQTSGNAYNWQWLCRQAIACRPIDGLADWITDLVRNAADPSGVSGLIEERWRAAERLGRRDVIRRDLHSLRPRSHGDDATWLRLLMLAIDLLIWDTEPESEAHLDTLVKEVDGLAQWNGPYDYQIERYEFVLELSRGWRAFEQQLRQQRARSSRPARSAAHASLNLIADLVDFVPLSWTRSFDEIRPQLWAILNTIAAEPLPCLARLTRVQQAAPALLAHLADQMRRLMSTLDVPEVDCPPHLLAGLVEEYGLFDDNGGAESLRERCVELCIAEAISPELVAAASPFGNSLSDSPVACVCLAHRLVNC